MTIALRTLRSRLIPRRSSTAPCRRPSSSASLPFPAAGVLTAHLTLPHPNARTASPV